MRKRKPAPPTVPQLKALDALQFVRDEASAIALPIEANLLNRLLCRGWIARADADNRVAQGRFYITPAGLQAAGTRA